MPFDAHTARALAPDEYLLIGPDAPGLRLQAGKGKRRTWIYRYEAPGGGKRQMKLGEWPAMPVAEAMGEWSKAYAIRRAGGDPAQDRREARGRATPSKPTKHAITVRAVCDEFLTGHINKHRNKKGAADIALMFRKLPESLLAMRAVAVTKEDATAFIQSKIDAPVHASNIKLHLAAAWEYARDNLLIPDETPNYWRQIFKLGQPLRSKGKKVAGKHVGTAKRFLSSKDGSLSAFMEWLPNFKGSDTPDVLTLYLWTACRGAEIVAMHVDEFSEEEHGGVTQLWWNLPKAKTKNIHVEEAPEFQRVPLFGRAEAIVRRRIDVAPKSGYLFPMTKRARETHIAQATISQDMWMHQEYSVSAPQYYRPRLPARFAYLSPHDLRRTARTMLAELKCPNEYAVIIIGHVQPGIVGTYNLYHYDDAKVEFLSKLSVRLEELAKAAPCKVAKKAA
jgi:integrase